MLISLSLAFLLLRMPVADSYISDAAREPGSVAELAASREEAKYTALDGRYMYVPIAFQNLGVQMTTARAPSSFSDYPF